MGFRTVLLMVLSIAVFEGSGCKSKTADQPGTETAASTAAATPAAPRITDPCKLLTQAEAEAAIGAKLQPGQLKDMGSLIRCAFRNQNIDNADQNIFLDVQKPTATVSDAVLFDSFTQAPDSKLISGMGDQAVWSHSVYASFLYIMKGGNMVAIGIPRQIATVTPEVEKAGKLVAGRM